MSTIVITGARGYIGSVLAKRLASEGHALRLVSRAAAATAPVVGDGARIEHIAADLRDERAWSALLAGADAVVHLSSRTDLRAAEADPAGDEDINVKPMRMLARAAARIPSSPVVAFASAATVVGMNPRIPVDESTPDDSCSVYDCHKLACERILREATAGGVMRACSLRLSNVYGYGAVSINANRGILNAMMKRAMAGEPLTLFGDGSYMRDFIHLDDVVDAFCRVVATPSACDGSHYVIASGRGHSLAEAFAFVAEEALAQSGRRIDIRHVPEPADLQPIERRNFVGDARRFRERTGWRPQFGLRAGIRDYFTRAAARPVAAVES